MNDHAAWKQFTRSPAEAAEMSPAAAEQPEFHQLMY
jgi:hypothetical protein